MCLAADKSLPALDVDPDEINGLPSLTISESVGMKLSALATALSLGLALGKRTGIVIAKRSSYSKSTTALLVSTCELMEGISANAKWIDELLDLEGLQCADSLCERTLELSELRSLFAKYAKNIEAMVAVDVAILKWSIKEIQSKPGDVFEVDQIMLQSLVALSMNPSIGKFFIDDILTVVDQIKHWTNADHYSPFCDSKYYPSLMMLVKFLDADSPIRLKVETTASVMYSKWRCSDGRMILGSNHSFVLLMENNHPKDILDLCNAQMQMQFECDRKLHSLCDGSSLNISSDRLFLSKFKPTYFLSANIEDDALIWKETNFTVYRYIYFENYPRSDSKQKRMFILCNLKPAALFGKMVSSCTSLKNFQVMLEDPTMKQMILTYGITIFESSSLYGTN